MKIIYPPANTEVTYPLAGIFIFPISISITFENISLPIKSKMQTEDSITLTHEDVGIIVITHKKQTTALEVTNLSDYFKRLGNRSRVDTLVGILKKINIHVNPEIPAFTK